MDDLISRQEAIDVLWGERERLDSYMDECLKKELFALRAGTKAERNRIEEDIEIITSLPSAKPEIIRCMDCEYYDNGRCNLISNEFAEARCKEDETCVFRKPQEYNDWVDVIRCKDCKRRYIKNHVWTCPFGLPSGPDGYCSWAERKEE